MSIVVNVNGESINYPQTGDTNWGDEATDFAVQTSSAFAKVGLSTGTTVDLPGTLDVTGNTTLDANLSVGGNASVTGATSLTGNVTLTNNLTVNGNTQLGNSNTDTIGVTGIVNVDAGTLYVDPVNNRVGINKTSPAQALDVVGNIAVSGNETVGGNLSINGNTTIGDASGDSLTINSNGVSIPNGLNFDSNTFVIDPTNNRVGIGVASPTVPIDIQADGAAFGINIRGRALDNIGLLRFLNNAGTMRLQLGLWSDDSLNYTNASSVNIFNIGQNGQLLAVVPGGSTLYPGFLCRAWVNFNGTLSTPITPRASGNVSSITKHTTGDYTVNFITAMPDVNYCILGSVAGSNSSSAYNSYIAGVNQASPKSINSVRISSQQSGTLYDADNISIGIFR